MLCEVQAEIELERLVEDVRRAKGIDKMVLKEVTYTVMD